MSTVFKIFWRDLKRVATNPVAVVVTLGVALIPALYAWFNILANWDPYENTSGIQVAVASLDKGATIEGLGSVNVGDSVTAALKENTKLGWRFVSEDEALDGVESGVYYAAIVIPPDFSSSMASVLTGKLEHPKLEYYVNEKLNPVAPKVTDTGASTVEQTIDQEFVGTVADVVAGKAKGVAGNLVKSAGSAADDAAGKVHAAAGDVRALATAAAGAQKTCGSARDSVKAALSSLEGIEATGDDAQKALSQALDKLAGTRSDARSLTTSLSSALSAGAASASDVSAALASGAGALAGDLGQAQGTADNALARLSAAQGELQKAKDAAQKALDALPSDTDEQRRAKEALQRAVTSLQEALDQQGALIGRLQGLSQKAGDALAGAQGGIKDANEAVQAGAQSVADAQRALGTDALPKLEAGLDGFAAAGADLKGSLAGVAPVLAQAKATLNALDGTLQEAADALGHTRETAESTAKDLDAVATDLSAVKGSAALKAMEGVEGIDPKKVADFMGSPVKIENESLYPVSNYGSGVTPFYTNLALFVGGFVLVSIYKLEVDKDGVGDAKPWQSYFGRWMLLNLVAVLQALVTCLGDLALGIQCASPAAFVFAGLVESFVYVSLVYALAVAFKHIGKALAVLLVILQIPGSSGLYPIQMQPGFFQALYPWLPFTYGNNAMREAIAGFYGTAYWHDLAVLLIFCLPAWLVGVGLRRYLLNVNGLFDRELRATGLMICERDPSPEANFRLETLVRAALDSSDYRIDLERRMATFEFCYPLLVRAGFIGLACTCLLLLVPAFAPDAKLPALVVWICLVIALVAFLLVVEYLHYRISEKTELSELSRADLLSLVQDRVRHTHDAIARLPRRLQAKGLSPKDETAPLDARARDVKGPGTEPHGTEPQKTVPWDKPKDEPTDAAKGGEKR